MNFHIVLNKNALSLSLLSPKPKPKPQPQCSYVAPSPSPPSASGHSPPPSRRTPPPLRRSPSPSHAADLDLDRLNAVYVGVGFPRRDPERIRTALEHNDALLWVEHRRSGKPVAFARATGDGVFNAIIWDLVVDPSFQGLGLRKTVVERLVAALLARGISNIALYSEPRVLGFYRPLGFVADPDGIRGMVYSRKQKKK